MAGRTNSEWVAALSADGPAQQEALADLRASLERAARFSARRRLTGQEGVAAEEAESLAEDAAQEACLIVLEKLDTFRGEARFLTWAGAIVVGVTMTALRRRQWRDLSLDRMPDGWQAPANTAIATDGWDHPDRSAERREIWQAITDVVRTDLTDRQRSVLNLVVLQGVAAEEVAERLSVSPGALYKLTHDARRKLKAGLIHRGFAVGEILEAFAAQG